MENNNQVHHRNGDKYEAELKQHKQFVEKDFPTAITEFRIGVLKNKIALQSILDSFDRYETKMKEMLDGLKDDYNCEYCQDTGVIEILGDSDNFEGGIIGHKLCPHCLEETATQQDVG